MAVLVALCVCSWVHPPRDNGSCPLDVCLFCLHRDIKPNNLLVSGRTFCWERVRIGDFGLATITKSPEGALVAGRSSIGSASYIAPEVLLGLPEDEPVDVYAAGTCVTMSV